MQNNKEKIEIWCDDSAEMSKEPPDISDEEREKDFAILSKMFDKLDKS